MLRIRLMIIALTLLSALFVGSGVASAGMGWCDWGSPPPMDSGVAPLPGPKQSGLPTPLSGPTAADPGTFTPKGNAKFTDNPVVSGAYSPPGMTKASGNK